MSKDTGGYAFPFKDHEDGMFGLCNGMTLRDYFAAKAMQGLLNDAGANDGSWEFEATAAYQIADAMLKARDA